MKQAKQVIVMRKKDLNLRYGKAVSQGCHASLGAILNIMKKDGNKRILTIEDGSVLDSWLNDKFTKICVGVDSEQELLDIYQKATEDTNLITCLITDAGLTEFHGVPTKTCCSILGFVKDVDKITSHLKLL